MKHIHRILFVFAALLGLTVFASAQTAIATDTAKSPAKETVTAQQSPTVKEVMTGTGTLVARPQLVLTEDTVLPQGLVNIAVVSTDMPIDDSLKLINAAAGRNYMRLSDQTFEKAFIDKNKNLVEKQIQTISIQRDRMITIAVTRTPDKIASAPTTTVASSSPSGGN